MDVTASHNVDFIGDDVNLIPDDTDVISDAGNHGNDVAVDEHPETGNDVPGEQADGSSTDSVKFISIAPNCPIQLMPFVGQTFCSLDEAYNFYTTYGRVCGFSIRIGSKHRSRDGTTLLQYWICHREGWNHSNKPVDSLDEQGSNGRNRKITRCGCKARLCVKYKSASQYCIYIFKEEHNHPLASEAGKQFLRTNRGGLNVGQQKMMVDLGTLGVGATRAHRFMAEMSGGYDYVGATLIDCKNFKRDLKTFIGGCDAQMVFDYLTKKKESCTEFTFEYYSDAEGTLSRLFWADSTAKRDANLFGDVISFDATYSSNKYMMVFVPFTAVDNHKCCTTLAAALISQEDANSYIWLLRCFKKFIGLSPLMLVTDQDKSMIKAVAEVFPETHHRFCMWHITEKLKVKVGVNICSNTDFIQRISNVIWKEHMDVSDFEDGWNQIITSYGLEGNEWLSDIYKIRAQWIPVYFKDLKMDYLTRTTSRSESENSFFGKFLHSKMTLVEFFLSFESAMDAQRHNRSKFDHESRTTMCKLKTPLEIEKHAAEVYTHTILTEVQNEISASGFMCVVEGIRDDGILFEYQIKDKCLQRNKYQVSFNRYTNFGTCTCNKFHTMGIVCRHLFLVFSSLEISSIPNEFIAMRWNKYATSWSKENFYGRGKENVTPITCELWYEFRSLVDIASGRKEQLECLLKNLKCLKEDFIEKYGIQDASSKNEFFASVLGMEKPTEVSIKTPNISRNKGRGKRIKGAREIAIEKSKKSKRLCSNCSVKDFHDAWTCPLKKIYTPSSDKAAQ